MKKSILSLPLLMFILSFSPFIINAQSTSMPWGAKILKGKAKIGGRIQGMATLNDENQDLYLRRLRLNFEFKPWKNQRIVYDVRNDNSNQEDRGDGKFQIGDAYWELKSPYRFIDNFKFFRAKVDVSYSQTSSSKHLHNPNRTHISEKASDYIVHNRRAANIQMNGGFGDFRYHLAVSDGVQSGDLEDVSGNEIAGINQQFFSYGGKVRYYFFNESHKYSIQDTFYGRIKRFALGIGHFQNDRIEVTNENSDLDEFEFGRSLTNFEIDFSYNGFRFLAEAFLFTGDLIDLTEDSVSAVIGETEGYYWLVEYVMGKFSAYYSLENSHFDRDHLDILVQGETVGFNYYDHMDARRYGISYTQHTRQDEEDLDEYERSINFNVMLNF